MTPSTAACSGCARLRSALRAVLVEIGWRDITAATVAAAAGLEVSTFTRHYRTVADCGFDAFDEAARECGVVCARSMPSAAQDCGEHFLRLTEAVLCWTVGRPGMARMLFVVPAQSGDSALLKRHSKFKQSLVALFDRPDPNSPAGRTHAEFLVGLCCQVIGRGLESGVKFTELRRSVLDLAPFAVTASGR
ncbi:AcrR family transcriptional regulator [Saccharomonospora amisosensis]|uniref:AcrR family transcriptional regulator n=1 Tax=Saccharomonospora amisosensis TaxID=1128677 RepID=A0A7X5ZSL7_9PSEU|nr:hypothetical protein [Saccharomonospora amisosensis]NIJ13480.1 AcrR family transcriptional regulator [Saccharomonospora amisosensis]